MGRIWVRRFLATLAASALGVACSSADPTAVLVKVSAQMPLRRIVIEVTNGDGARAHCQAFDVAAPDSTAAPDGTNGPFPLPVTLALVPSPGRKEATFRVQVDGYLAAGTGSECSATSRPVPDIRADAVSSYVDGAIVELPMPLTLSCFRAECDPSLTCRFGRCVDPSRAPGLLDRVAFGEADGTPCATLDACATVALAPSTSPDCDYDIPTSADVPSLVPYVVYTLPGTVERHVEFLDVSEFEVAATDGRRTLTLSPGLCNYVRANVIAEVGMSAPCPSIRNRSICAPSYVSASRAVLEGSPTGTGDGGTRDSGLDGAFSDAGAGAAEDATAHDGSSDAFASDAPTGDGPVSDGGSGEGGPDDGGASDSGDGDGDVPSDGGSDAGDDAGTSGDGGDGSAPNAPCDTSCCGQCELRPLPTCVNELGSAAIPTALSALALSDDGQNLVFLRHETTGVDTVVHLDTTTHGVTALGELSGDPLAAVAVTNHYAVVARTPTTNPMYDMILAIYALPGATAPMNPNYAVPIRGHFPMMASDGVSVFLLYRNTEAGPAMPFVVQRIDPLAPAGGVGTVALDGAVSSTLGQPLAMAASEESALVAFGVPGGAQALVHFDFRSGGTTRMTTLSGSGIVSGITRRPSTSGAEFAFHRSDAANTSIASWQPASGLPASSATLFPLESKGIAYVDYPGGGARYATLGGTTRPTVLDVLTNAFTPVANAETAASNIVANATCAYWIGDATQPSGKVRTARIPAR
ncbi:MAG: hypothetical protein U0169_04780 [Polyangiaceae bacterium]